MSSTLAYTQIIVIEGTAKARTRFLARVASARSEGGEIEFGRMTALAYARFHRIRTADRWEPDGITGRFRDLLYRVRSSNPVILSGPTPTSHGKRAALLMVVVSKFPITTDQLCFLTEASPGLRLTVVSLGIMCGHLDSPGGRQFSSGDWVDLDDSDVDAICALAGYPTARCEDVNSSQCY